MSDRRCAILLRWVLHGHACLEAGGQCLGAALGPAAATSRHVRQISFARSRLSFDSVAVQVV